MAVPIESADHERICLHKFFQVDRLCPSLLF
jgi:hypothetical protein